MLFLVVNRQARIPFLLIFILVLLLCAVHSPYRRATAQVQNPAATAQAFFLPVVLHTTPMLPALTTDGHASWSTPIAVSPLDQRIWTVNPDSGSLTVIDSHPPVRITEIPVGEEPWSLAVAPDGQWVYVTDRATGQLIVVDALKFTVVMTMTVGYELGGLALSPSGDEAYITSMATDEVVIVDTQQRQITQRIPVDALPYALAVSDDGDGEDQDERLYVTHLLATSSAGSAEATDDGRQGRVTVIDLSSSTELTQSILLPNENGFPNLFTSITLAGDRAWLPHVRMAPALPNDLTTKVFAAVSTLNIQAQTEDLATYLPLNDQTIFGSPVNNPIAALPAPDNKHLYVVLAGSDLVEVIDISTPAQPKLEKFIAVGMNPRGMALNPTGTAGYVLNYLSRSVSVLDLTTLMVTAEITTTAETLAPEILRGKLLFHNAVNPQLSQGSWISCASCHPDGGTDSVTWIFPDGPRQTPPLWNAGQTLPWHWSAALDEPQDVEDTIHVIQLGLGLAPGADPALLGTPNAGHAADLDALADFMRHGIRPPNVKGDPVASAGRLLFRNAGCVDCHGGPTWTASQLPGAPGNLDPDGNGMLDAVLRNVDTVNPRDIRGVTGFDPPSLLGVGLTAPYLHDGSMPSLAALLRSGHPRPNAGGNGLSETEIVQLVQFLHSIDTNTAPFVTP